MGENRTIINNLLSFISCKRKKYSADVLFKAAMDFYPRCAIEEAEKELSDIIPEYYKEKDIGNPLKMILDLFEMTPEENLPVFLCRDINNIPLLDNSANGSLELKVQEDTKDISYIKCEQDELKLQIRKISDSVNQLEKTVQYFANNRCNEGLSVSDNNYDNKVVMDADSSIAEDVEENADSIFNFMKQEANINEDCSELELILSTGIADSIPKNFYKKVTHSNSVAEIVISDPSTSSAVHRTKGRKRKMANHFGAFIKEEESLEINSDDYQQVDSPTKRLTEEEELLTAIVTNNSTIQNPFCCIFPKCTFHTKHKSWLKSHLRTHTGEKPFSCPYCPFKSSQNGNVTVHIRNIHIDVVSNRGLWNMQHHNCSYCKCRFWDEGQLSKHILDEHTNTQVVREENHQPHPENDDSEQLNLESPYMSVAGKEISSNKEFGCWFPHCPFTTRHKSWLTIHTRKHTGEKPFACPRCPFRATQSGNLKTHLRKMHDEGTGPAHQQQGLVEERQYGGFSNEISYVME